MERGLLKADEAATYLGLGRSKLYELIAAGELPLVRIGRAVRFPRVELDRLIEKWTNDAKSAA